MHYFQAILILISFKTYTCNESIKKLFQDVNEEVSKYNAEAAQIAWVSSTNPGSGELPGRTANYQRNRIAWQRNTCDRLAALSDHQLLNDTQRRQAFLLCRGPEFTYQEARTASHLYDELQTIYSEAEICFPCEVQLDVNDVKKIESAILDYLSTVKNLNVELQDYIPEAAQLAAVKKDRGYFCLKGENEIEKIMVYSRNEKVLRWLWSAWREKVGPPMKKPYRMLVNLENKGARRNGYKDIGGSWREDFEIPNLRHFCRGLYKQIRPLYTLLHGVVRYFLRRHYGDVIPERGAIPAHLLGNLWSQNWEGIANMTVPDIINLDESIKKLNWTVTHMVKRAEDFYQSLGMPSMTDAFWRKSVFTRENPAMRCHGSAADMFKDGDFRLISCTETTEEDFSVLHHELGHIQYYMAYEHQPAIFRQANPAFHEAIGDTIMYAVLTPQHLHRLGLINDPTLYSSSTRTSDLQLNVDEMLLLKQALNKIPQIPFSLVTDEFRWTYFEGKGSNGDFWKLVLDLQGVAPPGLRGEEYFDVGAKFHVPDNTPYIRYFLSSFLQHQIFESICKAAVFGRRNVEEPLPETIAMNRCDIYGSKVAGKILKDIMSRGHSQHWRDILIATIGVNDITARALERYYQPLYKVLEKLVRAYQIPIGW